MNEKDTGMGPHYSGMAAAVGLGVASGSAGMALLGYAGGQLIHRAVSNAARPNKIEKVENPGLRNPTQLGKYGK
jgi:hypothetical protein